MPRPLNRFLANSLVVRIRRQEQVTGILLLLLLILVIAAYQWIRFSGNAAPPGSDGGQWLAFSQQIFGGDHIRAGFQFYPPLVPFMVKLASWVVSPLVALKLVGIFTSVLIALPVYLLLRTVLHPWFAAIFAITVNVTPFHNEVLCFGGYPQLLGTSFLLFAMFFLLKGLNTGRRRWFLATGVATAATVGSNVLPALVLVVTAGIILLISGYKLWRWNRSVLSSRLNAVLLWWGIPAVILSLPFSNIYFAYLFTAERSPANPMGLTLSDIAGWAGSAWLWEFILWASILVIVAGTLIAWARVVLKQRVLLADAAVALLVSSFLGFLVLQELRFIAFIEIGLLLMTGLLLSMLGAILSRPTARRSLVMLTLVFLMVVMLAVGAVGYRRFTIAYNWYKVVDTPVLAALEWLRDNGTPEVKVATTGAVRGHNYGWWIEGYAHLPAYMAGDPFLFLSAQERIQVALAQRILLLETSPKEIRALVRQNSIKFLFLDKRVLHRPLGDFYRAGFVKRFENSVIIIMENKIL